MASGISIQTKVFESRAWSTTCSMIPAGYRVRMAEIWFREVEEMPVGVRRSVDVKTRTR